MFFHCFRALPVVGFENGQQIWNPRGRFRGGRQSPSPWQISCGVKQLILAFWRSFLAVLRHFRCSDLKTDNGFRILVVDLVGVDKVPALEKLVGGSLTLCDQKNPILAIFFHFFRALPVVGFENGQQIRNPRHRFRGVDKVSAHEKIVGGSKTTIIPNVPTFSNYRACLGTSRGPIWKRTTDSESASKIQWETVTWTKKK